jgi:hypothetical protein
VELESKKRSSGTLRLDDDDLMKNPISKDSDSPATHVRSETPLLYFGTPVVLISTVNEDGSYNLAPMSSAFWLGWRAILGLDVTSKTTANMIRTGECVLNLPSDSGVAGGDRQGHTRVYPRTR